MCTILFGVGKGLESRLAAKTTALADQRYPDIDDGLLMTFGANSSASIPGREPDADQVAEVTAVRHNTPARAAAWFSQAASAAHRCALRSSGRNTGTALQRHLSIFKTQLHGEEIPTNPALVSSY
jgi:hypothetical protein